jgi:hypothetical protein
MQETIVRELLDDEQKRVWQELIGRRFEGRFWPAMGGLQRQER